jgi:hypothetical protein
MVCATAFPRSTLEALVNRLTIRLLIPLVLTLAGTRQAPALPDDLSDGAFITHYVAQVQYTTTPPPEGSWDAHYLANYAISDCDEQVTEIPGATDEARLWFVLAAWSEDKIWSAAEFGIDYSPAAYLIVEHGPCFPGQGLTLPNPTWPAPGTGIALTVAGQPTVPWSGNFKPIYYFWGYTYGAGTIALIPDPEVEPESFIGVANANAQEFEIDANRRGAIGLDGALGVKVCPPRGACCLAGGNECQILMLEECLSAGGHFLGDATTCEPNLCPFSWACCIDSICFLLTEQECVAFYGGAWFEGELCEGFDCAAASSLPDEIRLDDAALGGGSADGVVVRIPGGPPARFELRACRPNPFVTATTILFGVTSLQPATLEIYDPAGRLVRNLWSGELSPASYVVRWLGTDNAGRRAPRGVYFARLRAGDVQSTQRIVMLE